MTRPTFIEPNYRVVVEGKDGRKMHELHRASDMQCLERRIYERIESGRIKALISIKPYDFERWKRRAAAAKSAMSSRLTSSLRIPLTA